MAIEESILLSIRNNDPAITVLSLTSQDLQRSDLQALLAALEQNTYLTTLDLTANPIGDEGALLLAQNTTLCSLIAVGAHIGEKGASALAKHPTLVSLDLCENEMGDGGIIALAKNSVLQTLKVGGNHITWIGASAFVGNSTLLVLDLTDNEVGDRGACALGYNLSLKQLKLRDCQISNEGAVGLARHPTLTHLELAYNQIGAQGAQALAENRQLLCLNLNYNKVGLEGAGFLAKSPSIQILHLVSNEINNRGLSKLVYNSILKSLDLSYNQINDESALPLSKNQTLEDLELNYNQLSTSAAQVLSKHPTLERLSLRHNLLGDEGALALAQSESLRFLDLTGNQLSASSALAFGGNTTLQSLMLSYNQLGDRGAMALAQNRTLLELYLSYNEIGDRGAIALAQNTTLGILDLNYNCIGQKGKALLKQNVHLHSLLISREQPPQFTEENLSAIFLLSQDLFCIRGFDDTIQFFNPAFSRVLGYRDDELLTKPLSDFLHPNDRAQAAAQQIPERQKFPMIGHTHRYRCKDGSYRFIQWSSQSKNQRIYGAGTDVTAQRKTQNKLLETERENSASQAHAEEASLYSERQSDFIAHLCHEIRNPLNGIYGNLQVIQEHFMALENLIYTQLGTQTSSVSRADIEAECAQIKECLGDMGICAEYERSILNDNLDISKMLDNQLQLSHAVFDLKAAAHDVYRILKVKAYAKDIVLKIELPEKPLMLKGDVSRIKQMLINLLGNALKFTEKGQVVFCLQIKSQLGLFTQVAVRVTDTGVGLSEEDIHKLFTRFSKASASTADQYGGSGLGLLIAKKLAQLMGGDVRVESEKGKGSIFHAVFECENALAQDLFIYNKNKCFSMDALARLVPVMPQPFSRKPTVLIVDDSSMNRKLLLKLLSNKGYLCLFAVDGEEAVEKNKAYAVDCILMDIVMPHLDGIEATRNIRAREREEDLMPVPIVGLSGNAMDAQRQTALAAGMNDYLTKPCKQEEIIGTLIIRLAPTLEMTSDALRMLSESLPFLPCRPLDSTSTPTAPQSMSLEATNITRLFSERLEALEKSFEAERAIDPCSSPLSLLPSLSDQALPVQVPTEADHLKKLGHYL